MPLTLLVELVQVDAAEECRAPPYGTAACKGEPPDAKRHPSRARLVAPLVLGCLLLCTLGLLLLAVAPVPLRVAHALLLLLDPRRVGRVHLVRSTRSVHAGAHHKKGVACPPPPLVRGWISSAARSRSRWGPSPNPLRHRTGARGRPRPLASTLSSSALTSASSVSPTMSLWRLRNRARMRRPALRTRNACW